MRLVYSEKNLAGAIVKMKCICSGKCIQNTPDIYFTFQIAKIILLDFLERFHFKRTANLSLRSVFIACILRAI